MPRPLKKREYKGLQMLYRPGTSDEKAIVEVLDRETYRKSSIGFLVQPGEHWLDLGSNVGAFAIYCAANGARADCYEPDSECYRLLARNLPKGCLSVQTAVSANHEEYLKFWKSSDVNNHYRGTLVAAGGRFSSETQMVRNTYISDLMQDYDGIKMDIEGSEFGILDKRLLPRCRKLCFEYHSSRDRSMERMKTRIEYLRSLFRTVRYPRELDVMMEHGGERKSFHDRVIFCLDPY